LEGLSVLVVDDDPVACEHAKLVLEEAGVSVQLAESGAEAVEMVRLRHARRDPFTLILVDWRMPGMDGVETTRQLRQIAGNETAIIILTAYNWDDVLEEALSAGVDSFIAKPLFATNVLEEFQRALKRKGLLSTPVAHADLTGRRMLLAEDMLINAEILKELMGSRQVELDHAENGRVALEMFAASAEGYYDAILMDMRMPEMGGLEATAAIRELDRADAKSVPIIALTANAFDEDVQQSLQAGLNAHLSKPVEPEDLFDTLEVLIAARE
jgi:CheY-like chemotaxis protein